MGGGYGAGRFRHGSSPVMYVGRASVKCGIKTQKSGCATRHMAKSPENQEPGYLDGAERWPNSLTCRVSCHFLPLDGLGRPDYSDVLPCHPVDVLIYMLSCHRAFAYPYAQPLQEARRAQPRGAADARRRLRQVWHRAGRVFCATLRIPLSSWCFNAVTRHVLPKSSPCPTWPAPRCGGPSDVHRTTDTRRFV